MDLLRLFGFRGNDTKLQNLRSSYNLRAVFTRITPYIYSHLRNCIGSEGVHRGRRLDSIRPSLLVLVILSLVPNASDPELASRSVSISEPDSVNRIQLHDLVPKRLPRASFWTVYNSCAPFPCSSRVVSYLRLKHRAGQKATRDRSLANKFLPGAT